MGHGFHGELLVIPRGYHVLHGYSNFQAVKSSLPDPSSTVGDVQILKIGIKICGPLGELTTVCG